MNLTTDAAAAPYQDLGEVLRQRGVQEALRCLNAEVPHRYTAVFVLDGDLLRNLYMVDKLGEAQAVAPAEADYRPTDPQIAFHLARFIEQVRSIPADPIIVRQNWLRAYDFTTDKGALFLNDYARANDPFAQIGKVQVAVDVSSVIRASPDSFRVAWTERRYQDGSLAATERWSAILTIVVQPPRTPDALRKNPLGVFVNALNWSRELSQ